MNISENGIKFIAKEEGFRSTPYLDAVGVPTIGYGSTYYENGTKVTMKDKAITLERGTTLFRNTLHKYVLTVSSSIKRSINQNQFDALVSLCYNIGQAGFASSTVVKRVNANPCDATIREAFNMWKKGGGKVLPGLVARRKREGDLYFS